MEEQHTNTVPTLGRYDQCHKKHYYDLESVQQKLGITQADVDSAYSFAKGDGEPVFLVTAKGCNWFISTYTE